MRLDYSRSFSIHWDTHYDGLEHQHSVAGGIHLRTFRHELIVAVAYVTLCPDLLTLMNICEA